MDMWCSGCMDWWLHNFGDMLDQANYLKLTACQHCLSWFVFVLVKGFGWFLGIRRITEQLWQNFWTTSCSPFFNSAVDTSRSAEMVVHLHFPKSWMLRSCTPSFKTSPSLYQCASRQDQVKASCDGINEVLMIGDKRKLWQALQRCHIGDSLI